MNTKELQNKLMDENFLNNALLFVLKEEPTEDERLDMNGEIGAYRMREAEGDVPCADGFFEDEYVHEAICYIKDEDFLMAARCFAVASLFSDSDKYILIIEQLMNRWAN